MHIKKTTQSGRARKDPVSLRKAGTGMDQEEPSCTEQLSHFGPSSSLPEYLHTKLEPGNGSFGYRGRL